MRFTRLTVLAAALTITACMKAEDEAADMQADSDSARAAITPLSERLAAHITSGNADSAASLYTDNAVFMPPNMPTMTGRAAIREGFAGMMQSMAGGTMRFTVQSVVASDAIAIERGRWNWTGTMGGQAVADSGKYLVHWHKGADGRWLIAEDIFNADTPPMPMPADSRKRG